MSPTSIESESGSVGRGWKEGGGGGGGLTGLEIWLNFVVKLLPVQLVPKKC